MKSSAPVPAHLRSEIFLLGNRHHGDVLKGAKQELDNPGLSKERRKLLRAVVRHLDPHSVRVFEPSAGRGSSAGQPGTWRHGVGVMLYAGAAVMLVTWAASALLRLAG